MARLSPTTPRNPRRTAGVDCVRGKRKTRRGAAKGGRKRAQLRADRRGWHLIEAMGNAIPSNGLPSNATANQKSIYVSPADAKAFRDELAARLGLSEARPKT